MWKECNMPFLFKLAQRVARLRSRLLLVTAAAVAGACARELAAPASGKPPVTLQISAADATPGGSVAVVLRATEPLTGSSPSAGYRFGDVNLDGLINVWDVLSLSRASAGTGTLGPQAFLLGNVRPVNGGATATAVPPCDPATSCRPGVTPADAQTPNGRIDSADAVAVASVVVGVSVPVVGQLVPTASVTPDTAVASVTISPAPASVQVGQTLQLTATPKDSAGGILVGRTVK